jgi:hypothetical protein
VDHPLDRWQRAGESTTESEDEEELDEADEDGGEFALSGSKGSGGVRKTSQPPFPKPSDGTPAGHHVAFIGYRFETPERGTNHNYYHAQPCRSMGQKDDEVETALPISYRMPTWPIAATCALELLLCFVASMYGLDGLRQLQHALNDDVAARGNRLLQSALKAMFALGWPKAES